MANRKTRASGHSLARALSFSGLFRLDARRPEHTLPRIQIGKWRPPLVGIPSDGFARNKTSQQWIARSFQARFWEGRRLKGATN